MNTFRTRTRPFARCAVATLLLAAAVCAARVQDSCRSDIDGDGHITARDIGALVTDLFGDEASHVTADPNDDGAASAADILAVAGNAGSICATASPTPSVTPTAGTVVAVSPTPTSQLTPMPHPTCMVQAAQFSVTTGELTSGDCVRSVAGKLRYIDMYSIAATPGQAITVDVRATASSAPFVPFVSVIDASGQFGRVDGAPPVQFVASTSQPYEIWVTSGPTSTQVLGPYQLTLSKMPCSAPVALAFGSLRDANLDGSECPDPGAPSVQNRQNPADLYTFTVDDVPTNVSITMHQVSPGDDITPALTVLGPDGFEIVSDEQNFDCTPSGGARQCAQTRFLALQSGTYEIIAAGGGGSGRYTLNLTTPPCAPTALGSIPTDRPFACPGQPGPGCAGTLYGDTRKTSCAAPLAIPGVTDGPDPSSPADLYTFTGDAGDVISIEMDSDDSGHLFLLGPASAGNPLVAMDDGSNGSTPQLAVTLARAGTYTIIAANDTAVEPPNPDDPVGDAVLYTMFVQRCPALSGLGFDAGGAVSSTFTTLDCFGFGGVPFRTYRLSGTAGQLVSVMLRSSDFDPFLRILSPDGSAVTNDNDLFDRTTTAARVSRILPEDGDYFVEVSSAIGGGAVDVSGPTAPAFTLQAIQCAPTAVAPGTITGGFENAHCSLPDGRKLDVLAVGATGTQQAASFVPPTNGCAVALLTDGTQVPASGCSKDLTEIPVVGGGQYGFMVAADDASTRGPYAAQLTSCPLRTLGYGSVQAGTLAANSCADATGAVADWFLFRAPAALVRFTDGVSGGVAADFAFGGSLIDVTGRTVWTDGFADDPNAMFHLGANLAAILKVTGVTPEARDSYTVYVSPAQVRSR